MVKSTIPELSPEKHKGQAGRVAVIGGSKEYTGAPYFAAYTVLRLGADLSHVFCVNEAAPIIKSYSPDLIVHPLLDHPSAVSEITFWLGKMHSVIIGPGLGREPATLQVVKEIIKEIREKELPLVIDADGVFLISQQPDVIQNYKKAVLTPNVVEYAGLFKKVFGEAPSPTDPVDNLKKLCQALGNVTIVQKGRQDLISDGNNVVICDAEGSVRRCGGQGDLLSGSMGLLNFWAHAAMKDSTNSDLMTFGPTIAAAYGACLFTRECSRHAFKRNGRCMVSADMINEIPHAYRTLFE